MALIISFYAGGSGNFLADFLSTDRGVRAPSFRVDSQNSVTNPRQVFLSAGQSLQDSRLITNESHDLIEKKLKEILAQDPSQILTHYSNVSRLKSIAPDCDIIKIHPLTNIFGLIKNIVFKKRETEFTSYQYVDQLSMKIDTTFILINDHYSQLVSDSDINHIIDFGKLYNIDYLCDLYQKYNNIKPDNIKLKFANDYISLQFPPINDTELKDFNKIVDYINPKDYFDIAVCLYIYEKNNNTIDSNRLWDINNIPNTIDESLDFLQKNANRYSIF